MQRPHPGEPGGGGEPGRRGQVPVRPDPHWQGAGLGHRRASEGQAEATPAVRGMNDQFSAAVAGRIRAGEV